MKKRVGALAVECFLDLGVTVVYAAIVGFLIVGIVATDQAPASVLSASLYAALLPASVLLLVAAELALRIFKEWRMTRRQGPSARLPMRAPVSQTR